MKKYLLILIVLLFVGCKNRQQNDNIIPVYNFTIPEMLSFTLDTQNTLTEGVFDPDVLDSTKLLPLDREATIQLSKIKNKVYNEDAQNNDIFHRDDSLYHDAIRFFIYGKLDLQVDVKSIVLWVSDRNIDFNPYHVKSFWLLNLKKDRICSVAQLIFSLDIYVDLPHSEQKTFLKDKIFTTTIKKTEYLSFWMYPIAAVRERLDIDEYYTRYSVNKDGFIQFISD